MIPVLITLTGCCMYLLLRNKMIGHVPASRKIFDIAGIAVGIIGWITAYLRQIEEPVYFFLIILMASAVGLLTGEM